MVYHLSSASHLREAARNAIYAVKVLKRIHLTSYTTKVGAYILRGSDNDPNTKMKDFEGVPLPGAMKEFATTLVELNNAICDIVSYRLFEDDYRVLLVLHDRLVVSAVFRLLRFVL